MILALDIGNTNITLGVYDGETLKFVSRLASDQKRLGDQYAIEIRDILDINGESVSSIEGSILSSVVPPITSYIVGGIEKLTGKKPLVVGPGIKTGLNILIENPAILGADFVAGAVAAIEMYPCPALIFDLGTATSVSVLDKNENFLGGCIMPGVRISLEALSIKTAQLPHISLEAPPHMIGRNSIDSMRSGSVYGTAAMIDGMSDRLEEELGMKCTVICTGGLSRVIVPHCHHEIIYNDNLLLEGLRILYQKNCPEETKR